MGHAHEVDGGCFVSAEAWVTALTNAGFRVEMMPGSREAIFGGTIVARFGHPDVTGANDVVARVEVEFFRPPPDAPPAVIAERRSRVARLRELDAPLSLIDHEAMMLAWLEGGRTAIAEYLEREVRERERDQPHTEDELRAWLAAWQGKGTDGNLDPQVEANVVFAGALGGGTFAAEAARWAFAAAYAAVSGGTLTDDAGRHVGVGHECLEPARLRRELAALRDECAYLEREFGSRGTNEPFDGWDRISTDDA